MGTRIEEDAICIRVKMTDAKSENLFDPNYQKLIRIAKGKLMVQLDNLNNDHDCDQLESSLTAIGDRMLANLKINEAIHETHEAMT